MDFSNYELGILLKKLSSPFGLLSATHIMNLKNKFCSKSVTLFRKEIGYSLKI